eukprot:1800651-Rhodomonas_salina.5
MMYTWTNGAQIPLNVRIDKLKDKQLGLVFAHHKLVMKLPEDYWWDKESKTRAACTLMFLYAEKVTMKGKRGQPQLKYHCIVGEYLLPEHARGLLPMQLPISSCDGINEWNLSDALDLVFDSTVTLNDIGLTN